MASYHSDHYFKEYGVPSTPLPICMLQLDPADRAVLRIAGMHFNPSAATKLINPSCANRNKSRLFFSAAEIIKKTLWQTVWTQIRLLL